MNKVNVAVLNCKESVYPQAWLDDRIDAFMDGLRQCGSIQVVYSAEVRNEDTAKIAATALNTIDPDMILINLASWHITPQIVSVIKNKKATPLLIYSMGGRKDETGKLHSPAAPAALTALTPALKELGYRFKVIYEESGADLKLAEIEQYAQVIAAYKKVTNARIGLIGYADMGLYTCAYDKTHVQKHLGLEIEDYFSYDIGKKMDNADAAVIAAVKEEIKSSVVFTNEVSDYALDRAARLYTVMKDKANDRGLDAISIKCVCGATECMGINPCMAQSLLSNKDLSVICECDAMGLITNVMMSAISGKTSVFMENYEFLKKEVLVGICGFLPRDFADGPFQFKASRLGDFFIGISCISKVKTGKITFGRLFKKGDGYGMFLSRAEARSPMKWTELGWEEPTPDFPSLLIEPEMDISHYVENCPGQHIIIVQGDYYDQMCELCKLMGIEVVS